MADPSRYTPSTGFARWLDARLPLPRFAHDQLSFPTPRNLNYYWTFGGILSFMLVAQIVTGVALVMHYTPDAGLAFDSVETIMRDVNYGWLIRYLHANGASMFFIAGYIHILRGLYYGSYKAPREVVWLLGMMLFLLMMATAFMGYVLPWGQMSFWGATVITSLFGAIPVIGDQVVTWLWGGYSVDDATLGRFFALHYLLPFVICAVVGLHVWALHTVGNNNPSGIEVRSGQDTLPFHPYYSIRDALAIAVFLLVYGWFVFYIPNYLGHPDNYIPANPMVTPPHIVPEWYFLPFYAILRAVPSEIGGILALAGSVAVLFALPWLDRSPVRSARFRPLYRLFFWLLVADVLLLGWLGSRPPEGGYVAAARLAAAWYFLHFLVIVPLLARIEKPRPLPASIAVAVLPPAGEGGAS
ncbi:cytochrome b N-terminal domain-containing protein [Pseudoxanthobacter sp.]|uniref:cytochrome b n=1 Tax=Pseudoxanthobacter sp. TaxID=1925742 RepID=UPI002FE1BCF4